MSGATAEVVAAALLALSLLCAVLRPFGVTEAIVALPAAAVLVAIDVVPWHAARDTITTIGPTVGFLAAILVFGHLCAQAGVFEYLGALAARASGGEPHRLLGMVVVLAALVTAALTLDATVVLLTPVVLTTTARLRARTRPYAYACTRIANSGSLLLPVSNLTNLLAFTASGLSFGRFTALMLLPWVLVCTAEWAALRLTFRADLTTARGSSPKERQRRRLRSEPAVARAERACDCGDRCPPERSERWRRAPHSADEPVPSDKTLPRYALAVLVSTVALFVVASAVHVAPAWAALAGCVALLVPRVRRRDVRPLTLLGEASPGFCLFVLGLAVVVDGVTRHGLGTLLRHVLPDGTSFLALLGIAAGAAVLANVVNNLPATLALVPILAGSHAAVLAMLLGVNVGPNATYPGSLATLLWRRMLPADAKPNAVQFHRFGLTTVPILIVLASAALWLALRTIGA